MYRFTIFLAVVLFINLSLSAQQSPFGTGQINNQNIGQLNDASVVMSSQSGYGFSGFFPDAQQSLQDYSFDIDVPADYDGTEAYGLVVFINSGNNGSFINQWLPVLDEKKLIWISGDEIGNPIFINIRMGVAMAGALRMQELFNIDTDRIYTSGNSGGARMAHNLAFIYPETFAGAMPSCGGSYIRQVDQDYETQQPDGHYESIISYPTDYLDYLLPFDQRFANLTSYNDFREGDIMNIYHNGSEIDGLKGKFLETSGGHCSTTTEHFRDAINFVEHPFLEVISEAFDGMDEPPFILTNAGLSNGSFMELQHHTSSNAQIQSEDLFLWDDPKGAIFETSIQLDPATFNMNSKFHLGIWSANNPSDYCGLTGNQLVDGLPSILLNIDFVDAQPTLTISVENPDNPTSEILYNATFSDWNINEPLKIKYHLWGEELRVELGAHLNTPATSVTGVRLLDDLRSIRIRWSEMTNGFWSDNAWSEGAFLTLQTEKNNQDQDASPLMIDHIELYTSDINITTTIPHSSSTLTSSICSGETYEFNGNNISNEGTYEAVLVNSLGCDSTVILNLTVNELPTVNISETEGVISADDDFMNYQWYYNGAILPNETGNTLTATASGNYYLEITDDNGCQNISNTLNVILSSIEELLHYGITVAPNPANSELRIDFGNHQVDAELIDLTGRVVMTDLKDVNVISHLENGIYLLKIQFAGKTLITKIQKI